MKLLIFLSVLFCIEVRAQSEALTSDFRTYIAQSKIGSIKEQSYCFLKDNVVQGFQPNKIQRIASITKLFSTLLISETTNLHQTFVTKIYIGKNAIHIEGGRDPYFEEDKLLLLLQSLNELGIKKLNRVSFNRDFLFFDIALGSYRKITPEITGQRIAAYLSHNSSLRNSRWQSVRKFAQEEGIVLSEAPPVVTASSVVLSDVNPLKNESTQLYLHTSRPLHSLLKTMNVQSKNYVAENIYLMGLQKKPLGELLNEFGISSKTYRIYNGSGLPVTGNNSRLDNLATCTTVLRVMEHLEKSLKKHELVLSDVMAVNGGKDLGSFRTRFEQYPETHESVISKTGTLKHTSSLAGFLVAGEAIPFAVLNHSTASTASRNFQDRFVARMFDFLGPATPIIYEKISIFPWTGIDFLSLAN